MASKLTEQEIKKYLDKKWTYEEIALKTGLSFNHVRTMINSYLEEELINKYSQKVYEYYKSGKGIQLVKREFYDTHSYDENKLDILWQSIIRKFYNMGDKKL